MAEKTKEKSVTTALVKVIELQVSTKMIELPVWVKNEYVCTMFNIELKNLARFRQENCIPFYKTAQSISYRLDELLEYQSNHKYN